MPLPSLDHPRMLCRLDDLCLHAASCSRRLLLWVRARASAKPSRSAISLAVPTRRTPPRARIGAPSAAVAATAHVAEHISQFVIAAHAPANVAPTLIVATTLVQLAMSYAQPHPRFSVLSSSSLSSAERLSPASSARFSLPSAPSLNTAAGTPKPATPRASIYDRPLNKSRQAQVSASAFAFLFSEVIQYTQKLNTLGYRIGVCVLELMSWRNESGSKAPKREIRFLPALMSIHTQFWCAVFGKPADAIEKSVENADEYMIINNDPPITRNISVPHDMSQLSCSSFAAGVVEAVL
ncbi:uncharacterized protein LAESUDRAFT_764139 [Laetiporus sulphureus 93-53]|uniref:Trafficking protein particle complex subunit n=1 Tax=Laetiporus sulphureus 93-53 TaxID=1314785 RepID=A0A165BGI5_9APHY|nr:uncharacterized protein LAESUDRAFT_764139 [Laetiporus sulphureus 93-53]KZT01014.1 hypothetical protein LAESUDRAFT_764139 [Laetiporus sulphureus 93-53]